MGRPYSLDLRERIVALHAQGELTQQQIADQLNLGVATVGRWVRRARNEGSPAAHRSGRGPAPLIGEREWSWIEEILRARPDTSMQEVAWDLEEKHEFVVSRSTVQKAVHQRGWTPKKRRSVPANKSPSASRSSGRSSPTGNNE
ncbi:MAG: transposase [Alphaproteobacteria bacterium]|nr:transposase [Alphaproteobacteria bacterium]